MRHKALRAPALSIALLIWAGSATARTERIGTGYTLEVPAPVGFVRVGADMPTLYAVSQSMAAPGPDGIAVVATYIPAELAERARQNELPGMDRWCMLQAARRIENRDVSRAEFAQMQPDVVKGLSEKGEATIKSQASTVGAQGDRMAAALRLEQGSVDLALQGAATLPPHDVGEGYIGWSGFLRYTLDATTAGGQKVDTVQSMTMYIQHVGRRMVQMVCYGEQGGLGWTRSATKAWMKATSARNP